MPESKEQKLIDICFQLVMTAHSYENFHKMSTEDVAKWVADQLNECGFKTRPIDMSWGVLIEEDNQLKKIL